jgi:hypothetical protein
MKEPPSSTLSYLAAFSLGIICATCIYLGLQRSVQQPVSSGAGGSLDVQQDISAPRPPRASARRDVSVPPVPAIVPEPSDVSKVLESSQAPAPEESGREIAEVSRPPTPEVIAPSVQPVIPISVAPGGTMKRGGGRISGTVRLRGIPPAEKPLPLDPACSAVFQGPKTTRFYRVGKDNGLADAVVVITSGLDSGEWAPSEHPLVIAESGCLLDPYVAAVQVNQPLRIVNREKIMHNVHITSASNGEFNRALLPGASVELRFDAAEWMIRLKCDLHPWEYAYVSAFPHPFFAVTDRNGDFVISNVPAGHYTVQAFHRKAGSATKEVSLEANRGVTLQFVLNVNGNNIDANRGSRFSPQGRIE